MLKMLIKRLVNPRKGSYAIMEFGECLNNYLNDRPNIIVDKDRVLKAFIDGKIDYDLEGIEKFIKK